MRRIILSRIKKLEMKGISKSFVGVKANQNVDLTIEAGDVLGLLGENGAGKDDSDEHPLRPLSPR